MFLRPGMMGWLKFNNAGCWTEFWEALQNNIPSLDHRKETLLAGIQSPQSMVQISFPTRAFR